ncbi:MAG: vitamin K epoxide reductase family protein [Patescibacteria group bacterium]
MMNLKSSSKTKSNNTILILVLALSFLGFIDAAYLSILHYKNAIPPCSIAQGCEIILTSRFASFANIPISLIGSAYYLAVIALSLIFIETKRDFIFRLLFIIIVLGAIFALGLILVQIFILKAICQYCLVSDFISLILFGIVIFGFKHRLFRP